MGPAPAPLDDGRLSADFVEWMQGFPPGWTVLGDGVAPGRKGPTLVGTRTQRLKALGNAVVAHQAVLALSMLGLA